MKLGIPALAIFAASQAASAQQVPTAGGQLQQIPLAPKAEPAIPDVRIERPGAPSAQPSSGPAFRVDALRLTGASAFSEPQLIAASGFKPGLQLQLGDLRVLASRIAAFYNAHGYFVAQAYLPAQDVSSGVVTIVVIEGRYGAITLHNHSHLSDGVANDQLRGLNKGDIVTNARLERRLLLLSDIPGVTVKSTLSPGSETGTSDLNVAIEPGRLVTGDIEADNAGNRYTGYYRVGATVNLNNPLGHGDVASLRGLVSDGGLTYVRASYQALFGQATIGVAYARLDYRLRREFTSLNAHGSADIVSVYGSYPLVRSYDSNLYLVGGVDAKFFDDRIDSVNAFSNKRSQVGTIGLTGDSRDHFGGGGSNFYSLSASFGNLDIRTPAVLATDAATARSNGGFSRANASFGRSQTLTGPLSLYVSARGQIASKNLDISEKMELGGAYAVRAYPEGEDYGDQGYVATAELRWLLPKGQLPGQVQLAAFIDNGGVTFNRNRFAPGLNHANLTGAGVGITWADANNFVLKASYAHRIGSTRVTSEPDSPGRVWVQAIKFF